MSNFCPTIRASGAYSTSGIRKRPNFVEADGIEYPLTAEQAWRLQDIEDIYFQKAREAGLSDAQLYKQAGNAMSVNVLEMIFRQIDKAKSGVKDGLF